MHFFLQMGFAQSGPAPPVGLETPWDARKILTQLSTDNQQLKPLLAQMNPQQWYDQKGASSTYIVQWNDAKAQVEDVLTATSRLSLNIESLSQAIDTYFRLEALDVTARSLNEGAQKYADRASADKLSELIAHNFNSREHFRDYLRQLATSKEQDFKVADAEAQRCRAMLSQQPPPTTTKKPKKN
jgi:hypothetical protein